MVRDDATSLRRLLDSRLLARLLGRVRPGRRGELAEPPASVPSWTGPTHGGDARRATIATAIARPLVDHGAPRSGPVPGEVVWTFLPSDGGRLRDRPVLVLGRLGADVLVVTAADEQDEGRAVHRPEPAVGLPAELRSLRLDRVVALERDGLRRAGTVVDARTLRSIVAAWRAW